MSLANAITPHVEDLFQSAFALLGDSRQAERAVSDTCRRAKECLAESSTTPAGRSWIFGLLLEEARRGLRLFAGREDDETLGALRNLPAAEAEVIVLVDVQGFRYQEAADALGISRNELVERLVPARRHFRTRVRPEIAGSAIQMEREATIQA